MKKTIYAIMTTLVLFPHAWAAGGKPDWVDGNSAKYPRDKFLLGIGQGDDRASAEDRSRAEIARIFSSLVTVNTQVSESETNLKSGEKNDNTFSQNISQNIQTVSKKMLAGVEVVENWQDKGVAQYYALAVLDRAKAMVSVHEKIAEFDLESEQWKEQLDKATEKLPRVKAAMKLLALLKARSELNAELRVLAKKGHGMAGSIDEGSIRGQAAKAVSELEVAVNVSGTSSDQVKTGVVKALNDMGFQAGMGGAQGAADIVVEAAVDSKSLDNDSDDNWKWARSSATVSIKDGKTDKIFVRFDATARQASGNYDEAVRRSLVSLSKKVATQINEAITAYFENL